MKQTSLFDTETIVHGFSVRAQLARVDQETRVWLDAVLERGGQLEVLDDLAAEGQRLCAVNQAELRMFTENRSRGRRRAWYRPARANETGWYVMAGQLWTFVAFEAFQEKQLGDVRRGLSDHERAKRTHWPKGATP